MKIYLETTVFNYYFDADRDAHPATVQLFKEIIAGKFEPYTSVYVVEELKAAPLEKNEIMLGLIPKFNITVLPESDIALQIANLYIKNNIIPKKYLIDATHIALAIVNRLDKIISLNFKHIVHEKTKTFTEDIIKITDYKPITINAPMEVIEYEEV